MNGRRRYTVLMVLVLLACAPAITLAQAPAADAGTGEAGWQAEQREQREAELEQRLREARARLEEAVREVGDLSARMSTQLARPGEQGASGVFAWSGRMPDAQPRAMLGVIVSRPRDERAADGTLITGVTPGGPADEAGLQIGDLIVGVNGEPLGGDPDGQAEGRLVERMQAVSPGDTVTLSVRRDGRELEYSLATRAAEPPVPAAWMSAGRAMGGAEALDAQPVWRGLRPFPSLYQPWGDMELAELSPELGRYFSAEQGILVVRAPRDRAVALRDGDVILSIGERTPTTVGHAMRILSSYQSGETLRIGVMRDHRQETLEVELPAGPAAFGRPRLLLHDTASSEPDRPMSAPAEPPADR